MFFLQLMLESLPAEYETQEINSVTLAYFAVSGLAILDALDRVRYATLCWFWFLIFSVLLLPACLSLQFNSPNTNHHNHEPSSQGTRNPCRRLSQVLINSRIIQRYIDHSQYYNYMVIILHANKRMTMGGASPRLNLAGLKCSGWSPTHMPNWAYDPE